MGALIPFDAQGVKTQLPAHIAGFLNDHKNIDPRTTIPQLSFRGKVWRIVLNGEETVVTKKGEDGEDQPVSIIRIVVVDHNKARSRAYYEGAYDPGKPQAPTCWSSDGERPDENVPDEARQARSCAKCPQAAKGSKITDAGNKTTACGQFKRVAIVPHNDLTFTPLLLKLPQTSLWDKENKANEAKGWYAWDQYLDMLRARGADHTAAVVTRVKFDQQTEYPKLLFSAAGWLPNDELKAIAPLLDNEEVKALLKAPENVVANRKKDDEDEDEDEAPAPSTKKGKKGKKAAPADEDDDGEEFDDDPKAAPAPAKKGKAAPPPTDDDDDADDEPAPPKKAKKVAAPADDDDDTDAEVEAAKAKSRRKPAKAAPADDEDDEPAPPKKGKKAAAPADDEDEEEEPAPPPKKAKKVVAPAPADEDEEEEAPAPKKPAKAGGAKNNGLSDLMSEWNV